MPAKTILLTGITGFVGGHLARAFLERGDRVVALARGRAGDRDARARAEASLAQAGPLQDLDLRRLEVIEGDLTADLSVPARAVAKSVDEVWHCAVTFLFEERNRDEILSVNVDGTRNVLELALALGRERLPRFFHVSTAYVCGRRAGVIEERLESSDQSFHNLYEWSKHEAEQVVACYRTQYGLQALIFRPSIVAGHSKTGAAFNHSGYYQVLRALFLLRRNMEVNLGAEFEGDLCLRLLVDRRCRVNLVPIDFAVEAMTLAARSAHTGLQVIHVTNEQPPSIELLHDVMCEDLRVSGLTLVEQEEIDRDPMDAAERLFHRRIGFQAPYVRLPEMRFATEGFRKLVPEALLPAPRVDREYLHRINRHYLEVLRAEMGRG